MSRAVLAFTLLFTLLEVFAGAAPYPVRAEERQITLAFQAPRDGHIGATALAFADALEANESSDINVVIQDGGDPYSDAELRAAVAAGELDIGIVSLNRFSETLPAVSIFYLPLRFSTLEEVQEVTALGHPVRDAIDAMITDTGVTPLWWQSYGQIVLLSPGAPAKTPLSLEGNKVRVFSSDGAALVEAAGAASARLPAPALAEAFAGNGVDFALIDLATLERLALWEDAEALTLGSFGAIEMVAIANPDFLENLTEDERATLDEAIALAEEDARTRILELDRRILTTANENGLMLVKLGSEELTAWVDLREAMLERYLETAGGIGEWMLDAWEQVPDSAAN